MDYISDVKNKKLGRVATQIATIMQGKHRVSYEGRLLGEDRVIVKGVRQVVLTGKKTDQKVYYRHAGKLGHLKERKFADVFAKRPEWVLRHAVNSMLPKNRLRARRIKKLLFQ